MFGWKYNEAIAAKLCKPFDVFRDFNLDYWLENYKEEDCHCNREGNANFRNECTFQLDPSAKRAHVVTMDTTISDNPKLRAMMNKGLNHIPIKTMDINEAAGEVNGLLDKRFEKHVDIKDIPEKQKRRCRRLVEEKIRQRMRTFLGFRRHVVAEPIDSEQVRREIEMITDKFLITPTDKAANTASFVCVNFIRTLALQRLSGLDFAKSDELPYSIAARLKEELRHLEPMQVNSRDLPYIMTVYKAHKNSFR
ncbi:hypothetical protein CBR_g26480 [Chara braunii]|uniref:Uncharacterized protein n=1 Tax=Chara braunii TaxID=69332 RepID=A0A388L819_CHABU|nr:hypothetical protein CBR_g26480 [Chara braunii]|eukprot:GBG78450.1 hypothetical protein CBR_g26480 [Chara braunii]